jgi:hypothetical protein
MANESTTTPVTADIIGGVALQVERSIKTLESFTAASKDNRVYWLQQDAALLLQQALVKLDDASEIIRRVDTK